MKNKSKYGVLVLHGFTCSDCITPLYPIFNEFKVPHGFPILRGHGDNWQELIGVKYSEWFEDAEKALNLLYEKCDKIIVIGHSMGGLAAIDLASKHKDKIIALVSVAAALKFQNKLAFLSPYLINVIKTFPTPKGFSSNEMYRKNCMSFEKFPTDSFAELYKYSKYIQKTLAMVECDTLIIHSKNDKTIKPKSAEIIYKNISSKNKELIWFEKSGHEMFLDIEAKEVIKNIKNFLKKIIKTNE